MRDFAAVAAVFGWALFLVQRALAFGFNPDDEMNLYFGIGRPLKLNLESIPFFWNGYVRPLGNVFYLVVYRMFGYWAAAFRIADFALIGLNLWLLYRLARTVFHERTAAFLVILLACFHREMWDIYASTGTVYDVLCQCFVLLALLPWVKSERRNDWRTSIAIPLLTIAAVDSKEIGIAIPAILLAYDLLFRPRAIRYASIGASGLVAVLFLFGRFTQTTAVTGIAAYTPVVSLAQFLMTTRWYLDLLLLKPGLSEAGAILLLVGAGALALAMRNRLMLFGLAFYLLTLLPMSFVPVRAGYALYIPQTGAWLYLVALFSQVRNWAPVQPWLVRPLLTGIFAICAAALQFSTNRALAKDRVTPGYLPQLEAVANGMRRNFPHLPVGSEVTLVNDPLNDTYVPVFTLRALYNDQTLVVKRVLWDPAKGPEQLEGVRNTLFFSGLRCWRFGSLDETGQPIDGRPREAISMSSPLAAWNIVADIADEPTPEGSRWAYADPQFVFSRPAGPSEFVLQYEVPGAVTDQTGPLRLNFEVDGKAPEHVVIEKPSQCQYVTRVPSLANSLVRVKIHAENPWRGANGEKLSFLVTWAGLRNIQ